MVRMEPRDDRHVSALLAARIQKPRDRALESVLCAQSPVEDRFEPHPEKANPQFAIVAVLQSYAGIASAGRKQVTTGGSRDCLPIAGLIVLC